MGINLFGCRVRLSYPLIAALTLVLINDTTGMCLCCILSALCHELGHLAAMSKLKINVRGIRLTLFDVNIKRSVKECTTVKKNVIVFAAGPFANIILFAVSSAIYITQNNRIAYMMMWSNIALALFNMLPVESLDGGGIATCLLLKLCSSYERADKILTVISICVIVPMAFVGFLVLLKSKYNFTLLFTSCYLMCIILCKRTKFGRN